jgi:hypothetical protein
MVKTPKYHSLVEFFSGPELFDSKTNPSFLRHFSFFLSPHVLVVF